MLRANRLGGAEPAPGAPLAMRRRSERVGAGGAVAHDEVVEFGLGRLGGRRQLGVLLDRLRLQNREDDALDAGEEPRQRVARGGGVEGELGVDDVLVAVARDDAHAGAELVVDDMGDAADSDDQVARCRRRSRSSERRRAARGNIQRRADRGARRRAHSAGRSAFSTSSLVIVYLPIVSPTRSVDAPRSDQERHRRLQSGAALGVDRNSAQMRRHLGDEADGGRAAQHPRRDAPPNSECAGATFMAAPAPDGAG